MVKVTFIAILSIQTLILSGLILLRKGNKHAHFLLSLVLFFWAMTCLNMAIFYGLLNSDLLEIIPYIRLEFLYGLGPSLYLYTKSITCLEYFLKKSDFFLFIPFVIEFVYYQTSYYRLGAFDQEAHQFLYYFFLSHQWAGVIYSSIFMVLSLQLLKKHKEWLLNHFSYTRDISLRKIQTPIVTFIVFWISWFVIRISDMIFFDNAYRHIYFFPMYIALSIITLWVGFTAYKNSVVSVTGFDKKQKVSLSKETIAQFASIAEIIEKKMKSEKYYLKQDLNLKFFAQEVGYQASIVSRVLNQNIGKNFHEFVNTYRVQEFIQRVKEDKSRQFTFLSHAFDSGFASKSSFNHTFKRQIGKTPKEYFSNVSKNK